MEAYRVWACSTRRSSCCTPRPSHRRRSVAAGSHRVARTTVHRFATALEHPDCCGATRPVGTNSGWRSSHSDRRRPNGSHSWRSRARCCRNSAPPPARACSCSCEKVRSDVVSCRSSRRTVCARSFRRGPCSRSTWIGRASAVRRKFAEPAGQSVAKREAGVASVSAPVLAADGSTIAAVSVSGPIERLNRQPGKRFGRRRAAAAGFLGAPLNLVARAALSRQRASLVTVRSAARPVRPTTTRIPDRRRR